MSSDPEGGRHNNEKLPSMQNVKNDLSICPLPIAAKACRGCTNVQACQYSSSTKLLCKGSRKTVFVADNATS